MKKELLNYVVVSNDFARYAEINLSCSEWKLLLYMISRIKKHERMFLRERFSISEFKKIMGVSAASIIRKSVENLSNKTFFVRRKECRLFEHLFIEAKNITYQFNEEMRSHLLGLEDNMTIFELGRIYGMNSKYSMRMYLFGISFKFMTYFNCEEEFFKRIIGLFTHKSEVMRRVLIPALKEINENTDIYLHCRYEDNKYIFAAVEKTEKQKTKCGSEHWKTQIEKTRDLSEIYKDLLADLEIE